MTYLTVLLEVDLDLADEVGDDNVGDRVGTLEGLVVVPGFWPGTMFSGSAGFSISLDSCLDFLDLFFSEIIIAEESIVF